MRLLTAAFLLSIAFALAISIWRPSDIGGMLTGLEGWTLDARFAVRGERAPPDDVAILAIDDATLTALDAFPPPRDALATALIHAHEAGAKVVAFDLLLSGDGIGDQDLAEALERTPNAILAVSLSGSASQSDNPLDEAISRSALALVLGAPQKARPNILGPDPKFASVASVAHVNVKRETDGALRRIPFAVQAGDGLILPALSVAAARLQADLGRADTKMIWKDTFEFGQQKVALDQNNEAGINFYGTRGAIKTYSLIEADTAELDGKLVFIGASAKGFGDTFASPFDPELPGVEALATMAANLLDGTVLRRDGMTWGIDILFGVLAALAGVWAASREKPVKAAVLTFGVWALALAALQMAFMNALWLDGVTVIAALVVATLAGGGARWLLHRRRASNLAQYQSPMMANVLGSSAKLDFDGRIQKAAALFVDAADFTPRTARLGPLKTSLFLKDFHACVEAAAANTGGVVEQYAGDGAMICFGLPEPTESDARNALRCADQLFATVDALSKTYIDDGEQSVAIRIGAHYGDVAAAVLGGKNHSHVTFVGDVINLASRLQETAKELQTDLVVSDDLLKAAGGEQSMGLTHQGERLLRGNPNPLTIWARLNTSKDL